MSAYPNDTNDTFWSSQVEIPRLNAPAAWAVEDGSSNTTGVVIIDTGVDTSHADLTGKYYLHPTAGTRQGLASVSGKTFFGDVDTVSQIGALQTTVVGHGHGTCVAGIVGAKTNNTLGVAACGPETRVMPARVRMVAANSMATSDIVKAVKVIKKRFKAADFPNLRVVNMSFGGPSAAAAMHKGIKKDTKNSDRLWIAAAGNSPVQGKNYPAAWKEVLGVTGVTWSGSADVWANLSSTSGSNYYWKVSVRYAPSPPPRVRRAGRFQRAAAIRRGGRRPSCAA